MKSLLLVTSVFPPRGGAGSQRMAALCRLLPESNWHVDVLTRSPGKAEPIDNSLLNDLPVQAKMKRIDPSSLLHQITTFLPIGFNHVCRMLMNNLMLFSGAEDWLFRACLASVDMRSNRNYSVVVSSYPGLTSLALGYVLSTRWRIPWVVDFRDPLTDNFQYAPETRIHDGFYRKLERTALVQSDAVVVTNKPLLHFSHRTKTSADQKFTRFLMDLIDTKETSSIG